MVRHLTFFLIASWSGVSQAQVAGRSSSDHNSIIKLASGKQAYALGAAPQALTRELALTSVDAFVRVSTTTDQLGGTHERYSQYYRSLPVEGAMYIVHARQDRIESLSGHYERIQNVSVVPSVPEGVALQRALRAVGAQRYSWQMSPVGEKASETHATAISLAPLPTGELVIVSDATANLQINTPTLAWKFSISAIQPISCSYLYVDAQSGRLLGRVNRIADLTATTSVAPTLPKTSAVVPRNQFSTPSARTTTSVAGSADTYHHGLKNDLLTEFDSNRGNYILHDYSPSGSVARWNIRTLFQDPLNGMVDFTDDDNIWPKISNLDYAATDVHWSTHMADDFFRSRFGRNSYDDQGGSVLNVLPEDAGPGNAIYYEPGSVIASQPLPGTSTPFQGARINYGHGIDNSHPMASADLVGHEYGHAINFSSAKLGDTGEPGALNEGLSDIWGACITEHIGERSLMWSFMTRVALPGTARILDNPTANGHPDTYLDPVLYDFNMNNSGHGNATVVSHWFYLLAMGGNGINAVGDKYAVKGIGVDEAAQIVYMTEINYLLSNSNFCHACEMTLFAAENLFGPYSPERAAVLDAWKAVNVKSSCVSRKAMLGPDVAAQVSTTDSTTLNGLYPNPVKNTATIALSKAPATPIRADIYDGQGRVVQTVLLDRANTVLSLQELQPGLYYLRYEEQGKARSQTFRIER